LRSPSHHKGSETSQAHLIPPLIIPRLNFPWRLACCPLRYPYNTHIPYGTPCVCAPTSRSFCRALDPRNQTCGFSSCAHLLRSRSPRSSPPWIASDREGSISLCYLTRLQRRNAIYAVDRSGIEASECGSSPGIPHPFSSGVLDAGVGLPTKQQTLQSCTRRIWDWQHLIRYFLGV
jgi:hypothetical protein